MNTELLIDNNAVAVERLGFHAQDKPFPGGHQFSLELRDAGLATDLQKRYGTELSAPSKSDAGLIFGMLNSVVSFRRLKHPEQPLSYVANSVSNLRIQNDIVTCSGICSQVDS
ncbi:MAG: hypothetical protein WDM96_17565 [Lacunisphaera sp.]